IVEPQGRNTAAAIALAALRLPADAVMLVCPSDHHIGDAEAFRSAARAAATLAAQDWLVSFGIAATAPETGFGYLKQG
ncbi:sugar phosphate nucleotidyltransferase, partial [Acinetobacter baumannii]